LHKTVLDEPLVKFFKRTDILFSLLVIIGILSWLTPILAILIKLESGAVFSNKEDQESMRTNLIVINFGLCSKMKRLIETSKMTLE
jgi:hypothetical protein